MAKIAVVLPTCRPQSLKEFKKAWEKLFTKHEVDLIVVEDNPETWEQLPDFIPTRTGSIRSWGFLQAYKKGYEIIVTLDDDCLPIPGTDPIQAYLDAFNTKYSVSDYFDVGHTFGLGEYMRGYPFDHRRAEFPLIQYGGWDNVPDMDAITQMEHEVSDRIDGYEFDRKVLAIPKGLGFTGCIMNVAMKREAVPLLYQLVMGNERVGYDRWDDIWSGLFAKKICDHLSIPILINGKATIKHTRASNTLSNLKKELRGYHHNEDLWEKLGSIELSDTSVKGCYRQLANDLNPVWFGKYGYKITTGMKRWVQAL